MNFEVTCTVKMVVTVNAPDAERAEEIVADEAYDSLNIPRDRINVSDVNVTDGETIDAPTVIW